MVTPELPELDDYLSRFSPKDRRFLETVQRRLYERPFTSKLREKVSDICSGSKTLRVLLVSAVGATSVGLILGNIEIFAGGVCLSSLWQTSNWVSHWRDLLTIGF